MYLGLNSVWRKGECSIGFRHSQTNPTHHRIKISSSSDWNLNSELMRWRLVIKQKKKKKKFSTFASSWRNVQALRSLNQGLAAVMSSLGWAAQHVEGTCLWESAALQKHFPWRCFQRSSERENTGVLPKISRGWLLLPGLFRALPLHCEASGQCRTPWGSLTSLAFIDAAAFNAPKAKSFLFFYCILCILCFLESLKGLKIHAKECKASPLFTHSDEIHQRW